MILQVFISIVAYQATADYSLLKDISCEFQGIMSPVVGTDKSTLVTLLSGYYQSISISSNISTPMWTEIYEDAFNFGDIYTVSLPIYYTEGDQNRLLGVVGVDITDETMNQFGDTK